jgi:tetratricopeptide (TPR) repeat protein
VAAIGQQAATDSAAAQASYESAMAAYREVVAAFPANADAATSLASLYSQAGRTADAAAVFDTLLGRAAELSLIELSDLGQRLVQAKLFGAGARLFALALERNPYQRNMLAEITNAYIENGDTARALGTVRRLLALDPLNRSTLRAVAQVWDLRETRDSAQQYATLADTLTVDISIASLVGDSAGATVTGVASNLASTASKPFAITIELLDAQGTVLASEGVDIAGLPAGGTQQFETKRSGKGIVGWRYRRA